MEDEQHIRYKQNAMLVHDAMKQEAAAWVVAFEKYFVEKEKQLIKLGYQPVEHGRIILHAYIDHKLETKLNRNKPAEAGIPVKGPKECARHLLQYFTQEEKKPEPMTQI